MRKLRNTFAGMCLAALPGMAWPHGDLDSMLDAVPGPNGGRVRAAGGYFLELLATPQRLSVFVTTVKGERPVSTQQAAGSALVVHEGGRRSVGLSPAGDNELRADGDFSGIGQASVAVVVTVPGSEPAAARFLPKSRHH